MEEDLRRTAIWDQPTFRGERERERKGREGLRALISKQSINRKALIVLRVPRVAEGVRKLVITCA